VGNTCIYALVRIDEIRESSPSLTISQIRTYTYYGTKAGRRGFLGCQILRSTVDQSPLTDRACFIRVVEAAVGAVNRTESHPDSPHLGSKVTGPKRFGVLAHSWPWSSGWTANGTRRARRRKAFVREEIHIRSHSLTSPLFLGR
jgi:hypothetical protein